MDRRGFLKSICAISASYPMLSLAGSKSFTSLTSIPIAASWQDGKSFKTGLMSIKNGSLEIVNESLIPSRAHEVIYEGQGEWLIVDRVPGNWLARYNTKGQKQIVQQHDKNRVFAGHMKKSADGKTLYTAEIERSTGKTIIAFRDINTLEIVKEFKSGGTDPHSFILDSKGDLWVANGGIPKHIDPDLQNTSIYPVESSISHMDGKTGKIKGYWPLGINNLSIRHLAFGRINGKTVLGGSIKAAHPTLEERKYAPILSLLIDGKLQTVDFKLPFQGYAGDIVFANDCFYLSCTFDNKVVVYNPSTQQLRTMPSHKSCALLNHTNGHVIYAGTTDIGIDSNHKHQLLHLKKNAQHIIFENHVDVCFDFEKVLTTI